MKRSNRARRATIIILSIIGLSWSFSQVKRDIVYLKSGGKAIGHIVKKVEGEPVLLKMQSDETIEIEWDKIKEIGETTIDTIAHPLTSPEKPMFIAHNTIYIEGFGAGILYSINYERFVSDDITLRIGFSSYSTSLLNKYSFFGIPVMANYLIGSGNSKLELGLGLEYVKIEYENVLAEIFSNIFLQSSSNISGQASGVLGIGSIAYRYQPKDGGLHFRVAFVPLFGSHLIKGWFGSSLGVCF